MGRQAKTTKSSGDRRRKGRRHRVTLPERSPLATAVLCVLGYVGAAPSAAAGNIEVKTDASGDKHTETTITDEGNGSTSIHTNTTSDNGNVGFNSFKDFQVGSGETVNLHHAASAEHLVNLVHDSRIEIDGIVNSLVNDEVGGHLIFADPHGMVVGSGGQINAGQLTLATPTADFMDSVVDGGAFGNAAATEALVGGTLSAGDIESDSVIEINGDINTTGGVHIHAGQIHVSATGAIEAGTDDAVDAISDAVNVSGIATGTRASVRDGRITITAETDASIADTRDTNPLGEDQADVPADDEFAVSMNGRLAVARSASAARPGEGQADVDVAPLVDIAGTDVRIGGTGEIDAQGNAMRDEHGEVVTDAPLGDGTEIVTDAGEYVGGDVRIVATDNSATESLWNPQPDLSLGGNVDIDGEIRAFDATVGGRFVNVGDSASIEAVAQTESYAHADGSINLQAFSERHALWGIVPVESGVHINGTLDGNSIDVGAVASAIVGRGPEDDTFTTSPGDEALDTFRGILHGQMSDLMDAPSFGVALKADADATVRIGESAVLDSRTEIDIASVARREVTTNRILGGLFTGISMARGELRGKATVDVADGSALAATGDIRLTGYGQNDMTVATQVINLPSVGGLTASQFALSYAHGVVDTDTAVTVAEGASLGSEDDRIGGLDLRAETANSVGIKAKSYALSGTGLSTSVALSEVYTDTDAALHADVAASDDVNVVSRSISDGISTFTDSAVGLNPTAMAQITSETVIDYASDPSGTFEGDLSSVSSFTLDEGIAALGGAAAGFALDKIGVGLGLSATVSLIDHSVNAVIGPESGAASDTAPAIDALGNVSVFAERVMKNVRVAGGSSVMAGIGDSASNAMAIGVAYTDINNDVDALIGAGTTIDARRVGVSAVSDMPLEIDYTDYDGGVKEFFERYVNICAGVCGEITTSYVASSATADGLSLTGNVNFWNAVNTAKATVADEARVTASAGSASDWTTDLPGLPLGPGVPGPWGTPLGQITLNWRDEIDIRSYARVEEVHVAGLFSILGTFIGAALGNGTNPIGGSMNYIEHDVGATTNIADGAVLKADSGDVGVRARTDEFVMAISPSAGAGGAGDSFVGSFTAGLVDIDNHSRALVSESATLTANSVTVAADHRIGAWGITGALTSSSATATVGLSLAGVQVDADVVARIGADADAAVERPAEDAEYTVRADELNVRSRSRGDVGSVAIQAKLPSAINELNPSAIRKTSGPLTRAQSRMQSAYGRLSGVPFVGWLSNVISKPAFTGAGSAGGVGVSGNLTGAAGFSTTDIDTVAELRNVRIGAHSDGGAPDVGVIARRGIDHLNVAGAAGINLLSPIDQSLVSGSLASTFAINLSGGTTNALVEGVRSDDFDNFDVLASRADGTFVAGLGSSASVGTASASVDAVISLSFASDDATTRAAVRNSAAGTGDRMRVLALDQSRIFAGSGAGTFSTTGAGLGLTVGAVASNRTIEAGVFDSDITLRDDLLVGAQRDTQTVAVGAAVGASRIGSGSGGGATIFSEDTVNSELVRGSVDVGGSVVVSTTPDIEGIDFVRADDALAGRPWQRTVLADPANYFDLDAAEISPAARDSLPDASGSFDLAIGGSLTIGGKASAAVGVAHNHIDNETTARIEGTTIAGMPQAVRVEAVDESDVVAVGVAGTAAGAGVLLGASVAGNYVDNTLTAGIEDATLMQDRSAVADWQPVDLRVRAEDASDARALAFSGAASGSGGTGAAAAAWNNVTTRRDATIDGGRFDVSRLRVDALASGRALATAMGVSVSGGGFGGAGSIAVNIIEDSVDAGIAGDADVVALGSVGVAAHAEQTVLSIGGTAAGSASGAGIGATVAVNRVLTDVDAGVGADGGQRTAVTALGRSGENALEVRDGDLVTTPSLPKLESIDEFRAGRLEASTGSATGVSVRATSLQSSSTVGGTIAGGSAVGLGLGASVNTAAGQTTAEIRDADINQVLQSDRGSAQDVSVLGASQLWTADAAVVAAGSGAAAVGAGATLNGVSRLTRAAIRDSSVDARGGVVVNGRTEIGTSLVTVGASGAVKGSVAAQLGLTKHAATTVATVRNSALNAGSLHIDADADNAALFGIGSGALGGVGGVGAAVGVLYSGMRTEASLYGDANNAIETNGGAVGVTAHTDSSLENYVVGVGLGGLGGVAASVAYSEFANRTDALVSGDNGERLQLGKENDRIGDLTVDATENLDVTVGGGGLGVGVAAAGVGAAASMIVGRSVVQATTVDADVYAEGVDIDARRDLSVDNWSIAGGAGFYAGVGSSASLIVLGDTSMGALAPELDAGGDGSLSILDSLTAGGEIGLDNSLISADAESDMQGDLSVSPALGDTTADATDGAFVRISNARLDTTEDISADASTKLGTRAVAGAGAMSVGGGIGVGVARTALHSRTQVDVTNGSRLDAGGSVDLSAIANDRDNGDRALEIRAVSGAAAGVLGFSGTFTDGANHQTVTVDVQNSRIQAMSADITAETNQSASVEAWAGAISALTGVATVVDLTLEQDATVTLAGATQDDDGDTEAWEVGALSASARNEIHYDHRAYGVGVGAGSFVGAQGSADISADSRVDLDRGLEIEVPDWMRPAIALDGAIDGAINLSATNELSPFGDERVAASYAGGLVAGAFPTSDTTVNFDAAVKVGDNVVLDTRGAGLVTGSGDIRIESDNDVALDERIHSVAAGVIAVSVGTGDVTRIGIDVDLNQSVDIGDDAAIHAGRDLTLSTDANTDVEGSANTNAGGVAAGATARGSLTLDVDHELSVAGSADLGAFRDITMHTTPTGATIADLDIRAYTSALGGGADARADLVVTRVQDIKLGADGAQGGAVRAGRDVRISTAGGDINASENWLEQSSAVWVPIVNTGGDPEVAQTDQVDIGMDVVAGYMNQVFITIGADDSLAIENRAGQDVSTAFGAWTGLGGDTEAVRQHLFDTFNPRKRIQDRIDVLGVGADENALAILTRIRDEMPDETVAAVRIDALAVSAGDITVEADRVTGGGSLTANGAPGIEIDNRGKRYLRIAGGLQVLSGADGGGTVVGAGSVAAIENDATVSAADALVRLRNTLETDPADAPAIFVERALNNPYGTVELFNANGDLAQFGPVIARVLDIDVPKGTFAVDASGVYPGINLANLHDAAGYSTPGNNGKANVFANSFTRLFDVIDYTSIDHHGARDCCRTTTDSSTLNFGDTQNRSWSTVRQRDTAPSAGESLLRAQWVGINADYIDINSDIEAGQNSAFSVALGADVRAQIDQHRAGANAGEDLRLSVDGPTGTPIGATWRADQGRIVLDPVEVDAGPGGVHLNGKIYSTVRDADITIHNGVASVDVDNTTGLPVELGDVTAGADGAPAVLKITDQFITDEHGNARTTWYVNSSEFESELATRETRRYQTYTDFRHWESGVSGAGALSALQEPGNDALQEVSGVDVYQPRSGTRIETYRRWMADSNPYRSGDNVDGPDWSDENWLGGFDLRVDNASVGRGDHGTGIVIQRRVSMKTDIEYRIVRESWDWGDLDGRDVDEYSGEIEWARYEERMFARADYDVGVAFEGGSEASVDVHSNASIIVGGRVRSDAAPVNLCAGGTCTAEAPAGDAAGIYMGADASAEIAALGIDLQADDGIGLAGEGDDVGRAGRRPLAVRTIAGSGLSALSASGSIDLQGVDSGTLNLERVHAVSGHVNIDHAAGSVLQAGGGTGATVRAQSLHLNAAAVGKADNPLRLEITDDFGRVDATAVSGIHLDAVAGDLPIGAIVTTGTATGEGDITLSAAGRLRAAEGRGTDFDAVVDDNQALWDELALTEAGVAAAREQDVEDFEVRVTDGYQWYWQIQRMAVADDGSLSLDAAARDYFQPFADRQDLGVETYLANELDRLDGIFDTAFEGTRPASLDSFDADFAYSAPEAVQEQVKVERKAWSLDELAAPLPGAAAQAATGTVLGNTPQHIVATGDVSLSAGGDIGRVLPDTTFTVQDSWDLESLGNANDARAGVMTAGAGDVACEVNGTVCAINDDTGTFDFQADEAYTFTIQRRQALRVDADGTLDATSGGNALIGDGDTVDGMTVGRIEAAGELRLLSAAAMTSDNGMLVNAADGIWLSTASGAIGTADDPISVAAEGAVQDAVGSDGVYLSAGRDGDHGGTLTLGRVAATGGGTIGIAGGDASYTVERVDLTGANLSGSILELDYTGTFGDADQSPLLSDGMTVEGDLHGSGSLLGAGSLRLGDLAVTGGDLHADATGDLGVTGRLDVDHHVALASQSTVDLQATATATGTVQAGTLAAKAHDFTQSAGTTLTVTGLAEFDLVDGVSLDGDLAAGTLQASGENLGLGSTGGIDVTGTGTLDFATAIDLSGDIDAGALEATTDRFEQFTGSVMTVSDRAGIDTVGDLIVADLRSTGTEGDAIDLAAGGAIAANGTARPQLSAVSGGIQLDAGTDIASADAPLLLSTSILDAVAAGDGWLELVGDVSNATLDVGAALDLTGDGRVGIDSLTTGTAADIAAEEVTLTTADIGSDLTIEGTTATTLGTIISGGAQTYTDGDGGTVEWTMLDAGGAITVDVGGDVAGAELTGADILAVSGAAVDLGTATTTGDQTLTATGALTADTLDTEGRLSASGDPVGLDTVIAGAADLQAMGSLTVADLTTDTTGELSGDTIELTTAYIGSDLTTEGTTATTLGTITSGGAQTYTDGADDAGTVEWTMLDAGGAITVDVGGDVSGTELTGADTLAVSGAAITLDTVDTAGDQDYRGDALTYGHIDAGTWSGESWGEGEITRASNIDADVTDAIAGTRARATGAMELAADTIAGENGIDGGTLEAATDIELSALTDVTVFELDVGGDLALAAGGRWTFDTLRVGGDVAARTTGATNGATAEVGGTGFFRAGYDANGAPSTPADLHIDDLAAHRARLHTTGALEVTDPRLARGIELRVDDLNMNVFDSAGGRFEVDIADAIGGQLDEIDLEVTGADRVVIDRLYAGNGRVTTDTDWVGIERGWITGELALDTPAVDLLVKNDAAELQTGNDVQLYARDERFWLLQAGRLTFTDAWIVRYGPAHGGSMPGRGDAGPASVMYTGVSAERVAQGRLYALRGEEGAAHSTAVDEAGDYEFQYDDSRPSTGPHPDAPPLLNAAFDCTGMSSVDAPGQRGGGTGDCNDFAQTWSARDGV